MAEIAQADIPPVVSMGQQLEDGVRIDTDSFPNLANAVLRRDSGCPPPSRSVKNCLRSFPRQLNVRLFHCLASYSCCAGLNNARTASKSDSRVSYGVKLSVAASTTRTLTVRRRKRTVSNRYPFLGADPVDDEQLAHRRAEHQAYRAAHGTWHAIATSIREERSNRIGG